MDVTEFFMAALFLFSVLCGAASFCYGSWKWMVVSFVAFILMFFIGKADLERECYCDACGTITNLQHQIRKTSNESVFLCDKCYKELKTNAVSE